MLAGSNTDKPTIDEQYGNAISDGASSASVVIAMGFADRELTAGRRVIGRDPDTGAVIEEPVKTAPLAVALERLLVGGDHRTVHAVTRALADMVWRHARGTPVKLTHAQASEMAKSVVAWYRHGICRACGGHGYQLIPGTKTHGGVACLKCRGSGKRPLEREFPVEKRPLVSWLAAEVEREAGRAGPRAMAHLAERLSL